MRPKCNLTNKNCKLWKDLLEFIVADILIVLRLAKFFKPSVNFSEGFVADLWRSAGSAHEIYDMSQRPHVNAIFTELLQKGACIQ